MNSNNSFDRKNSGGNVCLAQANKFQCEGGTLPKSCVETSEKSASDDKLRRTSKIKKQKNILNNKSYLIINGKKGFSKRSSLAENINKAMSEEIFQSTTRLTNTQENLKSSSILKNLMLEVAVLQDEMEWSRYESKKKIEDLQKTYEKLKKCENQPHSKKQLPKIQRKFESLILPNKCYL